MDTESYNSLSNMANASVSIFHRILYPYYGVMRALILAPSSFRYPVAALMRIGILCFGACFFMKKWIKLAIGEKILAAGIILALPLAMNISGFLSGFLHDLMLFAVYLFYIPIYILASDENDTNPSKRSKRIAIMAIMTGIIIFSNIQSANTVYVKKDAERQATISLVTQALGAIALEDGYQYGETPVVFIGSPLGQEDVRFDEGNISKLTGNESPSQITYYGTWEPYMKNVLNYKINICPPEQVQKLETQKAVQAMPCFPNRGSVKTIDGIIVVKFGENIIQ